MRLVAITDASDFVLRPRMEGSDQIVVPLPSERTHLVSVEVGLLVTRRENGEVMEQQKKMFSWKTRGAALRFYLPPLPGGDYIAELRATSTVMTASEGASKTVQLLEKSQISFRSESHLRAPRSHEFKYHFAVHRAAGDTPVLALDEDREEQDLDNRRLKTVIRNNKVVKMTLDCWASSDGGWSYNMQVSLKRCGWVRKEVLQRTPGFSSFMQIIEASHGEDNPPVPEPAGIPEAELREIQKQNRVVILRVYTTD